MCTLDEIFHVFKSSVVGWSWRKNDRGEIITPKGPLSLCLALSSRSRVHGIKTTINWNWFIKTYVERFECYAFFCTSMFTKSHINYGKKWAITKINELSHRCIPINSLAISWSIKYHLSLILRCTLLLAVNKSGFDRRSDIRRQLKRRRNFRFTRFCNNFVRIEMLFF